MPEPSILIPLSPVTEIVSVLWIPLESIFNFICPLLDAVPPPSNSYLVCNPNTDACVSVDVISIDLDGNDYYFCNQLLKSGVSPSLFIVEYNARFAPPIKFVIDYDKNHNWDSSDYYGASLQSFVDLFTKYQYRLICCNAATGVNAFFVKDINIHLFPEVPDDIEDIYTSPFFILHSGFLMPKSPKTFESIIK